MPYKDPEREREYHRRYDAEWTRKRREAYLADKQCEVCGATEDLRICGLGDGPHGSGLWRVSEALRNERLKGARILCAYHERPRLDPVAKGLNITHGRRTRVP